MKNRLEANATWSQSFAHNFLFWDERFEDYHRKNWKSNLLRDATAGCVVALVAIPLGIGFSIASGMRPEQGIIAGAIAGIIGGIFGGSKYQVYGPTAAFIPVIGGIVHKFDVPFMLLASVLAGAIIVALGLLRLGRFFALVPYSVICGFTVGIAATIAVSQTPNVLGEVNPIGHSTLEKLTHVPDMFADVHAHALLLAIFTFFFVRTLNKISVLIPAALISLVISTVVANQIWNDHLIPVVATQYGDIGGHMFAVTMPSLGKFNIIDLLPATLSIVFIGALESLLSSRMADRLASNRTPYNPNKELFGQGLVNVIVPLLNGFPCTGALARTATNIKLGAVSPFASLFKGTAVILMMLFMAGYLSSVPMAYVGGLLMYVASNMVKRHELEVIYKSGKLHTFLMIYTAVMTVVTELCTAVLSACAIFYFVKFVLKIHWPHVDLDSHHHKPANQPSQGPPHVLFVMEKISENAEASRNAVERSEPAVANNLHAECPQCGFKSESTS